MRLTWHSSACFSVESNDTRVLFDPWLESYAFLGSWAQWPPVKDTKEIIQGTKYEYIVYTHFHSDHFDARFLSAYLKTMKLINHKPTILVAENSWNQLSNSIMNIAGESANVKRIQSGEKFELNSKNFSITLYCSDHCEPVLCGKSIPCFSNNPKFRSIDSVALIEDATSSIINFNDAISSNLDVHLQKMGKRADLK
jgi:predicted metallo-beta-lactamase superfamily hydrolase